MAFLVGFSGAILAGDGEGEGEGGRAVNLAASKTRFVSKSRGWKAVVTIERGLSEPRLARNGRGDLVTCPPPSRDSPFSGEPLRLLGDKLLIESLLPRRLKEAPEKRTAFGVEGQDALFVGQVSDRLSFKPLYREHLPSVSLAGIHTLGGCGGHAGRFQCQCGL